MAELIAELTNLRIEQVNKVRIITIVRDERRNALNEEICNGIADAIDQASKDAETDDSVRVVMMRGEGKAFCAGADLGSSAPTEGADGAVYGGGFHNALWRMLHSITHANILVVGDVQGPAVGAGSQLSLACDLLFVGEDAWFGVPAAQLGFALDAWTINRAKDLLGGANARRVLLGAARVNAQQALDAGFASGIGTSEHAMEWAQKLAGNAPLSVYSLKSKLNANDASYSLTKEQQELYDLCWASEDAAEARLARKEKRVPEFKRR